MISDIGMPGMDGHQLMQAVRARPASRGLTGIALTGYGSEQDIQQAKDSGFACHLSKPVALEALIDTVRRTLGRQA